MENKKKVSTFFYASLLLWFVSVLFEIIINGRTQLFPLIAGFFFYQSSNLIVRFSISRDPLFVNTCVSLLHSAVTSASVAYVWLLAALYWDILSAHFPVPRSLEKLKTNGSNEMFEHSQLFGGTWPWAYPALCFSCGYFAYDQLDMLQYRLYSGWIPSILLHHLILLICFTLALYRNVTINYLILTLLCEIHSIFLHVRKVRRMAGFRDSRSKVIKIEWFLNWATFIYARSASHVLITVKLIKDAPKFGKGVELPLALFGMAGMNLLNLFLGIDLFKAFRKERKPQLNNHNPHHHE